MVVDLLEQGIGGARVSRRTPLN